MEENPYKSPETTRGAHGPKFNWSTAVPAALISFVVGLGLGFFALVSGAHGGPVWPTLIFSAPPALLGTLTLVFGHEFGYVYFVIGGTGVLYAMYALAATLNPRRGWCYAVGFHLACAVALLLWHHFG